MQVIPIKVHAGITGFESPAAEYSQLKLSLDELLVEHPAATFIGQAVGDSMIGVGIFDGDILVVDRHLRPKTGDVIVATLNGEFVCKLYDEGRRQLLSANSNYAPLTINEFDDFAIEGVIPVSVRCHRMSRLLSD